MTSYFSYVGDIDDPEFHWDNPEDAPQGGNLPRRILPQDVWDGGLGVDVFWMMKAIKEGRYEGKQLDWGAWGLKLTGSQIRALLKNEPEVLSALDEDKIYVLVAAENV
jgi:hypothetical protein